jgi:hypothetical protein
MICPLALLALYAGSKISYATVEVSVALLDRMVNEVPGVRAETRRKPTVPPSA